MTNTEIKQQLIQQFNDATRTLHQLEGAIQLLGQIEERDSQEVAEVGTSSSEEPTTTPIPNED